MKDVRLETGFLYEQSRVIRTETELFDVLIEDGKVVEIGKGLKREANDEVVDAGGNLLMPAFREMHIHIDKTYFGGPWKACTPITKGIITRIEEEQLLLPAQLRFGTRTCRKYDWVANITRAHAYSFTL